MKNNTNTANTNNTEENTITYNNNFKKVVSAEEFSISVNVISFYWKSFERTLNKIIKRIEKYGQTVSVHKSEIKEGKDIKDRYYNYYEVSIKGTLPKISNYDIIAKYTIENREGHNSIQIKKILTDIDLSNYNFNNQCHHCKTNRKRKHMFVLQEKNSKEIIQVGRTCLREFLDVGLEVLTIFDYIADIDESIFYPDYETLIIQDRNYYNLAILLQTAKAEYEIKPTYISFNDADCYGIKSTREIIQNSYLKHLNDDLTEINEMKENFINWVSEKGFPITQNNEYWVNVYNLTKLQNIQKTELGYIISAIYIYFKHLSIELEKQQLAEYKFNNTYFGVVGDKHEKEVVYINSFGFETMYGYMRIYRFWYQGSLLVWKTTKELDEDISKGDLIKLKFKIKSHEEFFNKHENVNEYQTCINYCKLIKDTKPKSEVKEVEKGTFDLDEILEFIKD